MARSSESSSVDVLQPCPTPPFSASCLSHGVRTNVAGGDARPGLWRAEQATGKQQHPPSCLRLSARLRADDWCAYLAKQPSAVPAPPFYSGAVRGEVSSASLDGEGCLCAAQPGWHVPARLRAWTWFNPVQLHRSVLLVFRTKCARMLPVAMRGPRFGGPSKPPESTNTLPLAFVFPPG